MLCKPGAHKVNVILRNVAAKSLLFGFLRAAQKQILRCAQNDSRLLFATFH